MSLSHRHRIVGTIDRRRALGLMTEAEAMRALAEAESGVAPPPVPPEPSPGELITAALTEWSMASRLTRGDVGAAVLTALEERGWQITRVVRTDESFW